MASTVREYADQVCPQWKERLGVSTADIDDMTEGKKYKSYLTLDMSDHLRIGYNFFLPCKYHVIPCKEMFCIVDGRGNISMSFLIKQGLQEGH